jgi:hypothetical protein
MAAGHGRGKHGRELGAITAHAYRSRVRAHLQVAPVGLIVVDGDGRPRYLLADARANQVAWITPHREQRSTFFQPRAGVHEYLRAVTLRSGEVRPLDLAAVRDSARTRTRTAARTPVRRIASVVRALDPRASARVP